MTPPVPSRLARRAALALADIQGVLADLALRRHAGPLGRYELRDARAALAAAGRALSRRGPPPVSARWGATAPPPLAEAVGQLRVAEAALSALAPPAPPAPPGRPRRRPLPPIPEHYGVAPIYPPR